MSHPEAIPPAIWDERVNTTDMPQELMPVFAVLRTEEEARRYLGAAVATRDTLTISQALARVELAFPGEARGMRMMALGQLAQLESILSMAPVPPAGISAAELEDHCDQATARGIASRALRQFDSAAAHLSVALFLARALGMRYREQHLLLELAQTQTARGRPAPELIEEALALPIRTSVRRREYAALALAEACLAMGDYRRARQLTVTQQGPQTGLWAFASALLGEADAQQADVAPGAFTELAAAVWALREGREVAVPSVTPHSPEAEYAAVLQGIAMLRPRTQLQQARHRLLTAGTLTADQRVWQLAALVHIRALGTGEEDITPMLKDFHAALDALRTREYVLPLLRALMPEAYMLLGLLPCAHPDVANTLAELPIVTGERVSYRFQSHKLPGKAAGSAAWVQAAATGTHFRMHRQAQERMQEALEALGHREVLNIGLAIRAIDRLQQSAPTQERDLWQAAMQAVMGWLDSDLLRRDLTRALNPNL